MGTYYLVKDGFLTMVGSSPDGQEAIQAVNGEEVFLGAPLGFQGGNPPYVGAKWHVAQQAWVDTRSDEERAQAAYDDVQATRYGEYLPVEVFMDAYYWAQRGDQSKMDAWLAHVDAVKARNPKP